MHLVETQEEPSLPESLAEWFILPYLQLCLAFLLVSFC